MKIYTCSTTDKIINQTASVAESLIKNSKKVIVFAEDKITLSLEIEIANRLGGGFFDAQILTFKRYVSSRNAVAKVLSKESSVMIIRKILSDLSPKLTCFKNALTSPNISVVLYELISQLESAKVTPSDLNSLLNKDENLSLALKNNAFTTKQLSCHYRSKTESLIAFSQKHYYDYMRTFPAAVPKTDEVGFKDFYVEGATVVSGVNKLEAIKVVEQLNEHFNKYYNPQTEVLSRTVGVVAFGKKQIDYIISLVEKDTELNNKIRLAILKAGVAPEKTVFFMFDDCYAFYFCNSNSFYW